MILRYDRVATQLPPPSEPDPAGAAAVQELLGGRFGEMSTFLKLHVPVLQLPQPTRRSSILRPSSRTSPPRSSATSSSSSRRSTRC